MKTHAQFINNELMIASEDFITDKKTLKEIEKLVDCAGDITRLLNPHHYAMTDSYCCENDINELLDDKYVDTNKWPDFKANILSTTSEKQQAIDFYQTSFEQLMAKYTKACIESKCFSGYEDITKNQNIIDISKTYEHEFNTSMPDINFIDSDIDTLRAYGWTSFLPYFDTITIKLNTKRYYHINVLNKNIQNKTFTVQITDYCGDKYQWISTGTIVVKFTFEDENENGLPLEYDVIAIKTYEEILTEHLSIMNWSQEEIQLWFDVLGINYINKMIIVQFDPDDKLSDTKYISLILSETHYQILQRLANQLHTNITILAQNDDVYTYHNNILTRKFVTNYFKLIGFINYKLKCINETKNKEYDIKSSDFPRIAFTISSSDNTTKYEIDSMKITSQSNINFTTKESDK